MAAICASDRSGGRFSVEAPRSVRTFAVAAFAIGSMTDTFACMSEGTTPPARSCEEAELDVPRGGQGDELVELGVREHEDPASLGDAVHRHVDPVRLVEQGLE